MAPSKARTNKDLLQLEHSDTSPVPGAKFLNICKAKKSQSIHTSSLKTLPLDAVVGESSAFSLQCSYMLVTKEHYEVQAFLPVLDEANRKLAEAIKEKGCDDYDIEVLKAHKSNTYVEMDLALGVADLHSDDAVSAAERLAGGQVTTTTPLIMETDVDNDSCNSSSEDENGAKRLPTKVRPKIEPIS